MIGTIAFDGDDTLWHNESIFSVTQDRFRGLVLPYVSAEEIDTRLLATEQRNLRVFGYGIKGFTLSMIETAIEVSGGRIPSSDISTIIEFARAMLAHPVELLEGVESTIEALSESYALMLITKGDLFDQESKIARSGMVDRFETVEIVAEKDEATYQRILTAHHIEPAHFLMVGNSLRSDVLPVLAVGGRAVHIPYHITWAHEHVELCDGPPQGCWSIASVAELPALLEEIDA